MAWRETGLGLTTPSELPTLGAVRIAFGRGRGRARFGRAAAAAVVVTLAAVVVVGAPGGRPAAAQDAGRPAARSFVSLFPLSDASEIDRYSLSSGRRLGVLVRLPPLPTRAEYSNVSTPHLLTDGDYLVTLDHGAGCGSSGGCGQAANTCASHIETTDPATGRARLLFTAPGSWRVFDAVPSPDGRVVALVEQACTGQAARLVVRDLVTRRERIVARHLSPCGLGSSATWTPRGTGLLFAYTRHPNPNNPEADCALAMAPVASSRPSPRRTLMRPDPKCSFESAAFDATGLVAAQTCATGDGGARSEIVQYDRRDRTLRRLSLQSFAPPQYGQIAQVVSDPGAHTVLVSQIVSDDPNVSWVWTFDGTKLHLVRNYFGASILAEP